MVAEFLLNQGSIRCEEHLMLKRIHAFVHGDSLSYFPLIVISKVHDDGRGQARLASFCRETVESGAVRLAGALAGCDYHSGSA